MEHKDNPGPESPADLEWSQGAKNPRIDNDDKGTLPSETTLEKEEKSATVATTGLVYWTADSGQPQGDTAKPNVSDTGPLLSETENTPMETDASTEIGPPNGDTAEPNTTDNPTKTDDVTMGPPKGDTVPKNKYERRKQKRARRKEKMKEKRELQLLAQGDDSSTPTTPEKTNTLTTRNNPNTTQAKSINKKYAPTPSIPVIPVSKMIRRLQNSKSFLNAVGKWPLEAILVNCVIGKVTFKGDLERHVLAALYKALDNIQKEHETNPSVFVPRFDKYRYIQGNMCFRCADQNSLSWLQKFKYGNIVGQHNIRVLSGIQLSRKITVRGFFPGPYLDNGAHLWLLFGMQNPKLYVTQWDKVKRVASHDGVFFTLRIDEDSLKHLESVRMRPYYGVGKADFQIIDDQYLLQREREIPSLIR